MSRVTYKVLKQDAESLSIITGENFRVDNWNGYYHIMFGQGEQLCSGTAGECHEYMWAFRMGYCFKESYQENKRND